MRDISNGESCAEFRGQEWVPDCAGDDEIGLDLLELRSCETSLVKKREDSLS